MLQPKPGTKRCNASKQSLHKHPKKDMKSLLEKFKGFGCTEAPSLHVSTPEIIRSEDIWEVKNLESTDTRKRKKSSGNQRNIPSNVVVDDVHNICCTPMGIGISSDFAPATRPPFRRKSNRTHCLVDRRNGHSLSPNPAIMSRWIGSRAYHRSEGELTERLLLHPNLLFRRDFEDNDRHEDCRLDVDDMSYEELLNLGDKIGYAGSGLLDEEISRCIKKCKYSDLSASMVLTGNTDWRCSICQEKCKDNEIAALECGHYHHVGCIKQWLKIKNACPICKIAALRGNQE